MNIIFVLIQTNRVERSAVVLIVVYNIIIGSAKIIAKDGDGGNNGKPRISETKQFCEKLLEYDGYTH